MVSSMIFMCLCSSCWVKINKISIKKKTQLFFNLFWFLAFYLLESLDLRLVLLDGLLPHHDLLLVLLQLVLFIVQLDTQAGLLCLELKTAGGKDKLPVRKQQEIREQHSARLLLHSPLLGDLVLPLHFLLLELSDVPHADLLAELHKHLILHLE